METIKTIYWLRLALGITAALICAGFGLATGRISPINSEVEFPVDYYFFINGISIALITYVISYYIIKLLFMHKVEKPQKLLTMGIGIYFLSWMVFWVLLHTIIAALLTPTA